MSRMSDLRIEFIETTVNTLCSLFHELPGVECIEIECQDEDVVFMVERNGSDEYYHIDLEELFRLLKKDCVWDSDDLTEWLTDKFEDAQKAIEAGESGKLNDFISKAKYIRHYFMKKRQARIKAERASTQKMPKFRFVGHKGSLK